MKTTKLNPLIGCSVGRADGILQVGSTYLRYTPKEPTDRASKSNLLAVRSETRFELTHTSTTMRGALGALHDRYMHEASLVMAAIDALRYETLDIKFLPAEGLDKAKEAGVKIVDITDSMPTMEELSGEYVPNDWVRDIIETVTEKLGSNRVLGYGYGTDAGVPNTFTLGVRLRLEPVEAFLTVGQLTTLQNCTKALDVWVATDQNYELRLWFRFLFPEGEIP